MKRNVKWMGFVWIVLIITALLVSVAYSCENVDDFDPSATPSPTPVPPTYTPPPTVTVTVTPTPTPEPGRLPNSELSPSSEVGDANPLLFLIDATVLQFEGVYLQVYSISAQAYVGDNIENAVSSRYDWWHGYSYTFVESYVIEVTQSDRPIVLAARQLNFPDWCVIEMDPIEFGEMVEGDSISFTLTIHTSADALLGPQEQVQIEIYEVV